MKRVDMIISEEEENTIQKIVNGPEKDPYIEDMDAYKEEFNTPLLQQFAAYYLNYMHSSPLHGKANNPYFKAPDKKVMPLHDIIYGNNRKTAYHDLMSIFEICMKEKEFDRLLEGKNIFWRSKAIPKLVILREWLNDFKTEDKPENIMHMEFAKEETNAGSITATSGAV